MNTALKTTVASLALAAAAADAAYASPRADQGDMPFVTYVGEPHAGIYYGQSFVVGISGHLAEVTLPITLVSNNGSNLDVYIIKASGLSLVGAPLAHATVPFSELPPFFTQWPSEYMRRLVSVNFAPQHVTVTKGETIAIVIGANTADRADWWGGCDGTYAGQCGGRASAGYGEGYSFATTALTGPFTPQEAVTMGFLTFVDPTPFSGTPGSPNCDSQSIADLKRQFGGLAQAAASLGYSSPAVMKGAITGFCSGAEA